MTNNDIYILNPHYHLRNDTRRILLFSKFHTNGKSSNNWYGFIHPLQAIMLGFFTYKRNLKENITLLSQYLHRTESEIERYVIPFINNDKLLSTHWHNTEIIFPKNVLVKASQNDTYLALSPDSFICHDLDLISRRLYNAPLSITLMLTNRCVTHCNYCYADTHTRIMNRLSTERICELIEEAGKLQMKSVNLIGGEIFLHPDWALILKKTVDYKVETEYISTKMPLTSNIIDALLWTGYKGIIQISLDSLNSDVLKSSLNVGNDYLKSVINGIMLLDDSGLKFQVSTVLTTYNSDIKIMTELFSFLSKLKNITTWNIVTVHDSLNSQLKDFHSLKPSHEQLNKLFEELKETVKYSKINVAIDENTLNKEYYSDQGGSKYFKGNNCSALSMQFFILPDGKVTICEQLYWHPYFIIGDVCNNSLSSVWNSKRAKFLAYRAWNDIRPTSKCYECTLNKECFEHNNRCWVDIMKAYGKDNYDYPDPRCEFADKMKNYIGY